MRIAVAGFMHESNTFHPVLTDRAAFVEQSFTRGATLIDEWRDAPHEVGGFLEAAHVEGFEAVPLLMAWATPGGPVADDCFDSVTAELCDLLRDSRADGLLLALHGAMVAQSILDADGEVLARLRRVVGPEFPITVTLDLHGNISQRLVDACRIAVAYRTCPHVDQRECGRRAASLLVRQLRGEIRPCLALAKPPLLINIMAHDTSLPPLSPFMDAIRALEQRPGILAASLLPGFAYADVPQMGPSVLVVSDGDPEIARRAAEELAEDLWQARERFVKPLPNAETAVAQALRIESRPVILVDTGDNVGGGSAGDGTTLLSELLRQGATESVVCLYAPEEVRQCISAGVNAEVSFLVGGKADRLHGEPISVTAKVRRLHDGTYIEPEVRHGGRRVNNMGTTALVEIPGRNLLVLHSLRHPPFSLGQLTSLGIQPREQRILIVKAAIAYKAAYAPLGGTIIEVDTPGTTAVNPERFTYRHIRRPLYPLC
jgi:microcystin degradation protein MlrC